MQKPTSAVLTHFPQFYRVIHTFFNRTCCYVYPMRITIKLSYFLFTFIRYTKSLKFSAVCKLKCNPISVRWYNTNKSSTLFSPNVSFSQEAKFVLLPAADYDGCKNLSLHSTSYGPISGRRRRQHAQKTSSRMKRRNGLELTFC